MNPAAIALVLVFWGTALLAVGATVGAWVAAPRAVAALSRLAVARRPHGAHRAPRDLDTLPIPVGGAR